MTVRFRRRFIFTLLALAVLLSQSAVPLSNSLERVRSYTRAAEFDYIAWTADAVWLKLRMSALGAERYLPGESQRGLVREYLELMGRQEDLHSEMTREAAYDASPRPLLTLEEHHRIRQEYRAVSERLAAISPLAEAVLQRQVNEIITQLGIDLGGQGFPPPLYHTTPVPMALVISPRSAIRQDANISLLTDLTPDQIIAMEEQVSRRLDVSALVVPIGGIGLYPTMVMRSDRLEWLAEVVAHEWIHNYLTLRPLGLLYEATPELRTMNETAASLAGEEISQALVERFYPELQLKRAAQVPASASGAPAAPTFQYNAEMRSLRVQVDALLAQGQISEAEQLMETRRQVFLEHGYLVRKINQAYFAFYGAYADDPGGAAGNDPVGPAVRALRERSASLADFLVRISQMTSFEQLREAVRPGS